MWVESHHLRARLASHREELRSLGVERLAIFGSRTRNDWRPDSDLDVLVDIDPAARISLIDLVKLRDFLSEVLGVSVDLTERASLRPRLATNIDPDVQLVFEAA